LERALTHSSYANEHGTDPLANNERLEFLGDAVVDFIAGAWLFDQFPDVDEGRLTSIRAALVRVGALAAFAREAGLPDALKLGKGEIDTGGRDRDNILGDAFEALVGAIYLDQGADAARDFLVPFLERATPSILQANLDRDAKSRLQEWSQSALGVTPRYRLVGTEGPDHAKKFWVAVWLGENLAATGSGTSKQQAEQLAAREALIAAAEALAAAVAAPLPSDGTLESAAAGVYQPARDADVTLQTEGNAP
jgi:ribonuclease-3